jgi:hypothetical protein
MAVQVVVRVKQVELMEAVKEEMVLLLILFGVLQLELAKMFRELIIMLVVVAEMWLQEQVEKVAEAHKRLETVLALGLDTQILVAVLEVRQTTMVMLAVQV